MDIIQIVGVAVGGVALVAGIALAVRGVGNGGEIKIGPVKIKGGPGVLSMGLGAVIVVSALVGGAWLEKAGEVSLEEASAADDDCAAPDDDSAEDDDSADDDSSG